MDEENLIITNNDDAYHAVSNNDLDKENNNKQNIKKAADIAIASKNPYAMAAGGTVKAMDKLTGGKSTEALTKVVGKAPAGKFIQNKLNKTDESSHEVVSLNKTDEKTSDKIKPRLFDTSKSDKSHFGTDILKNFGLFKKKYRLALLLVGCGGGFFLILIIILFIVAGGDTSTSSGLIGLQGYDYVQPKCTDITVTSGANAGTYTLEEYVAGVLNPEFGSFLNEKWMEAAKAGAVAARTYVQTHVNGNCEIESSSGKQNFGRITDLSMQIATETKGLVLVDSNNNLISTEYDAFCTDYNINQNHVSESYYIVCQKEQMVPKSWVDSIHGIKDEWKAGNRTSAHGRGMSQWGAAYLAENGYSYDKILAYYYDNAKLASVYSSSSSTNWTQAIDKADSDIKVQIANQPLKDILSRSEINELNMEIYNGVKANGIGSRDAVVLSAVTSIKYLYENYGILIPYTLSGGHYESIYKLNTTDNINKTTTSYFGIDPDWGTEIDHTYPANSSSRHYYAYGPDCSSFVAWAFHNGGTNMPVSTSGNYQTFGQRENMCSSYIAKPGDILEGSGHVTLIVGVDEAQKKYYIAHAAGGDHGVIISKVDFCSDRYYIVNMDGYYENSSNVNNNYEAEFEGKVISY